LTYEPTRTGGGCRWAMHLVRRTISGGDRSMTGETIRDLLEPVIGKSGAIHLTVSNIGQVGLAINENSKLTGVEVRPDGLVRLERETGWTVINPSEVRPWRGGAIRSSQRASFFEQTCPWPAGCSLPPCQHPLPPSSPALAAAACPAGHAVPGTGRVLATPTVAGHHSRCARGGRGIALVPCRCPVVSPRTLARRN
jgi:hypothetical protein